VKKLLAAIAAIAIVVVVLLLTRRGSDPAARPAKAAPAATQGATPVEKPGPATTETAPSRLKKISPEERRALEQKIDASRAAHGQAATRAGETPHLPKMGKMEDLPPAVVDAVKEALPLLDACYNHGSNNYGPNLAVVQLTLHGAGDVGTIVNANEMHDEKGAPIDKEVADCIASTMQSLQLPPIDLDVPIQFSFRY